MASNSSLHQLVAAVRTNLNARVLAQYPEGVPCLVDDDGDRQTVENRDTPSILFRYVSGEGRGPKGRAGGNPRTLWLRQLRVETKIWGADVELAEKLYVSLGQTLWDLAHGSIGLISETWTPRGTLTKGEEITVVWGPFLLPLTEAPVQTAQPTTIGHRSGFTGSDEDCGHDE